MKWGVVVLLGLFSLTVLASDKLNTPFKHFSVIADGVAGPGTVEHGGKPGTSFLGMRLWASSPEEDTEPLEPPRDAPHAYGVKFTPYAVPRKK